MPTFDSSPPADSPGPLQFRRHLYRSVVPALFAAFAFGQFAYRVPGGDRYAVPGLLGVLAMCALLHGGLVVSRDGIAWYCLRPAWRYREIPWGAVLDIRKGLLGLEPRVRLIVRDGRFEPWVWGTPRPERQREFAIHTNGLVRGDTLRDAIDRFRTPSGSPGEGPTARRQSAADLERRLHRPEQ